MQPFTDNIIFWDTEFTDLDPYKGEILSVGMIKPNGEELYIEIEHTGETSDWVKKNLLPDLTQPKISREEATKRIFEFIGPTRPSLVAYVNQFDTVYLYKLINSKDVTKNFPFHWIFIDFASMLFAQGLDPESFNPKKPNNLLEKYGIDPSKYNKHNALDDARLLRDIYLKVVA